MTKLHRPIDRDGSADDDDSPQGGVRRARHLDAARRGRRPAGVLRPVRPAAPRPGGRRDRRQRRPAGPGPQGRRARRQRVHARDAGAAHRLPRHRPHPLLAPPASNAERNIQPFLVETMHGPLAARPQRQPRQRRRRCATSCCSRGFGLTATSDTEVMTLMLAAAGGQTWEERIERTLPAWKGAFSLVHAGRRPGDRRARPVGVPAAVGRPPPARRLRRGQRDLRADRRSAASTSSEVQPGEIVTLQRRRDAPSPGARAGSHAGALHVRVRLLLAGPTRCGTAATSTTSASASASELARESPADADVVIPVPDSSIPAAIGYSSEQRHPVQRRADQEPLHRPHVHRADPGHARTWRGPEVQRARARTSPASGW